MHVLQGLAYSVSFSRLALAQRLPVPVEPVTQRCCCCMPCVCPAKQSARGFPWRPQRVASCKQSTRNGNGTPTQPILLVPLFA